jgi:Do/DeqQ family serine protease
MQRKRGIAALAGAVLVGFVVGACVRQPSNTSTQGITPALAQGGPGPATEDLAQLSATYAAIAKRVTPAVVNINSETVVQGRTFRDPFGDFFGGGGTFREPEQRQQGLGSGVIVDPRGVIVTNNHVVQNATTITVTLSDRRRFPAKLIGTDPYSDLAVLRINAGGSLPTVPWADSDATQVGDIVLAIGSPYGLASTVTQGIISAKERRDLGISTVEDFLQTDASINPGNSGGALVDIQGRLVGINTAILSKSGGNVGIGLAIPSNLAKKISGQISANGRVSRGYLGINAEPLSPEIAQQLGISANEGVLITGVSASGPVGQIPWSRQGGNILRKVNGQAVDSPRQLRSLIASTDPGSQLQLEVWIDGKVSTHSVKVAPQPQR